MTTYPSDNQVSSLSGHGLPFEVWDPEPTVVTLGQLKHILSQRGVGIPVDQLEAVLRLEGFPPPVTLVLVKHQPLTDPDLPEIGDS